MATTPSLDAALPDGQEVVVTISPKLYQSYEARGVFPAVRPEQASVFCSGRRGLHRLSAAAAQALLRDAQEMLRAPGRSRGLSISYAVLARSLQSRLAFAERKRRSATVPHEESLAADIATFSLHDVVQLEPTGEWALVAEEFGLKLISPPNAALSGESGSCCSYRYGYLVECRNGTRYFAAAHQLLTPSGEKRYLRLVN